MQSERKTKKSVYKFKIAIFDKTKRQKKTNRKTDQKKDRERETDRQRIVDEIKIVLLHKNQQIFYPSKAS
jgi:hypothetical protein